MAPDAIPIRMIYAGTMHSMKTYVLLALMLQSVWILAQELILQKFPSLLNLSMIAIPYVALMETFIIVLIVFQEIGTILAVTSKREFLYITAWEAFPIIIVHLSEFAGILKGQMMVVSKLMTLPFCYLQMLIAGVPSVGSLKLSSSKY